MCGQNMQANELKTSNQSSKSSKKKIRRETHLAGLTFNNTHDSVHQEETSEFHINQIIH
jgi:hypothetical protein